MLSSGDSSGVSFRGCGAGVPVTPFCSQYSSSRRVCFPSAASLAAMAFKPSAWRQALPRRPKLRGTRIPTAIMRAWRVSSSSVGVLTKALRPAWAPSWTK
jgi:hypothetical protein